MKVETFSEQVFFNTVKITMYTNDGGKGSGTGFYFEYQGEKDDYCFIVTNKHVVNKATSGSLSFIRELDGAPDFGSKMQLDFPPDAWAEMWVGHPDPEVDIAVCSMKLIQNHLKQHAGFPPFLTTIHESTIPTPEQLNQLNALEEVTFIGYPDGLWDKTNLLPIARRGTTATPLQIDFEGKPIFLIDASVFGGSSGSPVFILNEGVYSDKYSNVTVGARFYFFWVL